LNYLWVALGSALGGVGRYACTGLGTRWFGESFPWGTLFVNVAGSLLIGVLAVVIPADSRVFVDDSRDFLMIGLLGGFTTFSSFSLQTLNLARDGQWGAAAGYTLASLVLCLVAVAIGCFGTVALAR
jgi:CrcB protein